MTTLHLELGINSYDINIGSGLLARAAEFFDLKRKVIVVTDSGVPVEYSETVAEAALESRIVTVDEGESSKSFEGLAKVLSAMKEFGMTRSDAVVAVGGGVVGDLAGFAASAYMRGVDFYNVPTTLLSQVDSSIGGKTAINFDGVKNIVGAFYQPKGVLIDPDCLRTLDHRLISCGLAEALKMSMTSDENLFNLFEKYSFIDILANIEQVIVEALKIKKSVVEQDERESGLRKILNFGHTFGHGIEAEEEMNGLYHGECVALGMIPLCEGSVRKRLVAVLKKLSLPTEYSGDVDAALSFVTHDKKCTSDGVSAITVPEIGSFKIEKITIREFSEKIRAVFN